MDERVRAYLAEKRASDASSFADDKAAILIEAGLYEKVYSPDGTQSEAFPYREGSGQNVKYFNRVFAELTDEEFQEVAKYAKKPALKRSNSAATKLRVIAWLSFVGAILWLTFDLELVVKCLFFATSLVEWAMFLGFAEIINLLEAIKNK